MSYNIIHITKKSGRIVGLLLLAAFMTVPVHMSAQKVSVKARLDSAYMVMGKITGLHIDVEKPHDLPGHFPLFSDTDGRPYATLNGDTVELSKQFTTDTVKLGAGRERITYHVPVQVFDSGYYKLPQFNYVVGSDTVLSNSVELKVVPVDVDKDAEISGLTDVADPETGSWTDNIPEWLREYWWAILIGLIAVTGIWLYARKHMRKGPKVKKAVPALPPYEEAVKALLTLKKKDLWQKGQDEEYFVELTDILRRYLSRRFSVAAPEMTTTQFLDEASRNPRLVKYNAELRRLLELADFVKFAKGQSLPDENEEAFAIVLKFVEDTKPSQQEAQELKEVEKAQGAKQTITDAKIGKKGLSHAAKQRSAGRTAKKKNKKTSAVKRDAKRKEGDK